MDRHDNDLDEDRDGREEDEEQDKDQEHEGAHAGPWWTYPPILGAIVSGILLAVGWLGDISGALPDPLPIALYIASIPFGGYWWAREGLEELVEEREVVAGLDRGNAAHSAASISGRFSAACCASASARMARTMVSSDWKST